MAIPWLAIILSIIVLISVFTVLGIVLYKHKLKRLRQTTKIKKPVNAKTTTTIKDVEAAKNEQIIISRISTPPFKDKVEPMSKGQFVRPCHVTVIKSISNISQNSLPSLRTQTPPSVIPITTPTDLCAPINLIDRRPSATELIEAELMCIGKLPTDYISELDEREKQKRKYKSSQIY
uniref:Uncharacterized protein n=1 Tax=Panagrolaimus superbus TaxID=310955 RepID=A0A914Z9M7_9BILA